MKQEDKQLLVKNLCAMLPYGVKATTTSNGWNGTYTVTGYANDRIYLDCPVYDKGDDEWLVEFVKPYLRPMSSMTEEEEAFVYNSHIEFWIKEDYCNKHYLDYRGLISMGLALEAPDGMYCINSKTTSDVTKNMLKYIKDAIAWDRFAGDNGAWVRISDLNYIESEKGYSPALNGRTRCIFHSVYPYQDWMEEYIGTNKNLIKDKRIEKVFDL